jgi:hypothetical protein
MRRILFELKLQRAAQHRAACTRCGEKWVVGLVAPTQRCQQGIELDFSTNTQHARSSHGFSDHFPQALFFLLSRQEVETRAIDTIFWFK